MILNFDIRIKKDTEDALNSIPEEWRSIDVLLNNAGLASGLATINSAEVDDWETMIDTISKDYCTPVELLHHG